MNTELRALLDYILESPERKYGGFHPEVIRTAKMAKERIEELEARPEYLCLTIEETADQLRMSAGYVRQEIREGRLRKIKLGVSVRVEYAEIVRYIESLRVGEIKGSACVPWESLTPEEMKKCVDSISGDTR